MKWLVALALFAAPATAMTIAGRVIDENGAPLAGIDLWIIRVAGDDATCCARHDAVSDASGGFSFDVVPDVYVIATYATPTPRYPARVRVDARTQNQLGIQLQLTPLPKRYVPDDPPRAAKISVSAADEAGDATVRGEPGAVAANSYLIAVNVDTGHIAYGEAASDGSFSLRAFAPAGTHLLIESDPYGDTMSFSTRRGVLPLGPFSDPIFILDTLMPLAGTFVAAPVPPATDGRVAFGGAGGPEQGGSNLPAWVVRGSMNKTRFAAGETLDIEATITIRSSIVAAAEKFTGNPSLTLERLTLATGEPLLARAVQASALLTPTAFAIEHDLKGVSPDTGAFMHLDIPAVATDRAEASFTMRTTLRDVPDGYYRPIIQFFFDHYPIENPPSRPLTQVDDVNRDPRNKMYLPIVRVGNPAPPRMFWTLLTDVLSSGTYGAAAIEDATCCAIAPDVQVPSKTFIIPRVDERTQTPIAYRLEPFLPFMAAGDRGVPPAAPAVEFRFPSGALTARIDRPDGTSETIGPAPFVQTRVDGPIDRHGRPFDGGGRSIHDVLQLSTMDPRFEVRFPSEGRYRITLDGQIDDVDGVTWRGHGTYDLAVGREMALDTATLPGTPYEIGDAFTGGIAIRPPVPADVEIRVQLFNDDRKVLDRTLRGTANRFGAFGSEAIGFAQAGEYRVDVEASSRDAGGRWWFGSRTWGGVVAPRDSPIIAHGRRGIDQATDRQIWFFRSQTDAPPIPNDHVHMPFQSGDVAWMQERDALLPLVTFEDRAGGTAAVVRQRYPGSDKTRFDSLATIGEIPLFPTRADQRDPHLDPSLVDLWAYGYRSVQRPAIRVREQIAAWDEGLPSLYWRFSDWYGHQLGIGRNGDRPNDFKFQFAGAVIRGPALGKPAYGIYGSLFVLVPDDDPRGGTRVFPPFQGNPGPSGGPLFTLKGRDIDLFFHPTAVRPGSVLVQGDIASFAGYSAPTLPSKIVIDVTAPSGRVRTIKGQANKVGYFYDPGYAFAVDEPGVWKAKATISFDGRTSAGQVTPPFPTGGVLGSRDGEFFFYVVRGSSAALSVTPLPQFVRPADAPITFNITPPPGLHDVQLTYTTTIPGFILEEGSTGAPTYTYDVQRLARDFPNLDLYDADGFAGADTVSISFLLSGTDSAGKRQHFARQIVLQGEELQMPEQKASPAPPRRRATR